jgi:cyclopropane-fatty-acyl-phospholipid synthase
VKANIPEILSVSRSDSSSGLWLRKQLLKKLSELSIGKLIIDDPLGSFSLGEGGDGEPVAHITIVDLEFYRLMAFQGALGAAEAYIQGMWSANSLTNVVRILVLNQDALIGLEGGSARLQKPLLWMLQKMTRNTHAGSRKNIAAHYDLSNEMFKTFLDRRMMYSSAFFKSDHDSLETASEAKLARICTKLGLNPEDHVVEIGTGWGGFAIYAAKNYGCRVTTTTISEAQYEYAAAEVRREGLSDRITLLKKDYRDLTGKFDKLVSIEMIEAVGDEFLGQYMETCSRLLKPKGVALIQAITINDQIYDRALKETDFIKKYIFPGSFIPSLLAIMERAKTLTDLRLYHMEDMTSSYAKTLKHWRERFLGNRDELVKQGFDERFIRMWDYYFCYCIGGFMERSIGSVHLVFAKPGYRGDLSKMTSFSEEN